MEYGSALFAYTALIKLADALTVLGVWYAAWHLRFQTQWIPVTKGVPEFSYYSDTSWTLLAVYLAVFHMIGGYRRDRIHFGMRSIRKVFQGSLLGLLAFISVSYLLRNIFYSRVFLIFLPALIFPAILAERVALHFIWRWAQTKGIRRMRILIVGYGEVLQFFIHQFGKRNPYPVDWVGRLGVQDPILDKFIPFLGSEKFLEDKIEAFNPDQIIVALPTEKSAHYDELLSKLGNYPVTVKLLPDFGKFNTFSYQTADECGVPVLNFNLVAPSYSARALKRLMDIFLSLAGILFLSPLFGLIALLVKLSSKGKTFYAQERIGANGHRFACYKFRTMYEGAETATGPVWAKPKDDRTTPIGMILRKTSLDELPQLFNILRGDMSLVGPRPERPHFVDRFRKEVPKYLLRHSVKSGLTGWAQVNGWRGNTSIEERIKFDLYYIGHWSLYFDIKIILLTFLKGFINKNAY